MGLIPNQTVEVRGKIVPVEELTKGSSKKVKVICDCCGETKEVIYKNYNESLKTHNGKYYCTYCIHNNKELKQERYIKAQQTLLNNYGVEHPYQSKEILGRAKATWTDKYGVDNPMKNKETHEKAENTCLEKYGHKNPKQVSNFKIKAEETCMEHYGTKYALQNEEIKDKVKHTCIKKYGVDWTSKVPEIYNKMLVSRLNGPNGIPTSKEEQYICDMIINLYPNATPGVLIGKYVFDILLEVDGVKIDIECDGAYWHDIDNKRDIQRDMINRRKGYKILRIRYNDIHSIPTEEEIKKSIEELLYTNKEFLRIGYME